MSAADISREIGDLFPATAERWLSQGSTSTGEISSRSIPGWIQERRGPAPSCQAPVGLEMPPGTAGAPGLFVLLQQWHNQPGSTGRVEQEQGQETALNEPTR